jgi:multimeric flavodoxin WrbA
MLIISAGNVAPSGERSQSLLVARSMGSLLRERGLDPLIVDLRRYRLEPCDMCEGCASDGSCVKGDDFNALARLWREHGELAIVCPHYAGIPSKLVALIEKVQENSYLASCQGKTRYPPKKAIVLAHGGMTEDFEKLYEANLITPLSNMLTSAGCKVLNEGMEERLCFGVKAYREERDPCSVCYGKDDDVEGRERVIRLAVERLLES